MAARRVNRPVTGEIGGFVPRAPGGHHRLVLGGDGLDLGRGHTRAGEFASGRLEARHHVENIVDLGG